jgi:hypothetical protein
MSDFGVSHFDGKDQITPPEILLSNSIAEMWTFAEVDFAIITRRSGFGKLGSSINFHPSLPSLPYSQHLRDIDWNTSHMA